METGTLGRGKHKNQVKSTVESGCRPEGYRCTTPRQVLVQHVYGPGPGQKYRWILQVLYRSARCLMVAAAKALTMAANGGGSSTFSVVAGVQNAI